MRFRRLLTVLLLLAALPAYGAPRVVVSLLPLHSIVSGVMEGVGEPILLIRGYGSPHAYQMRPSEARALSDADLVIWVGEPLETFLERPLAVVAERARVIELLQVDGLVLHPARAGGAWETGGHSHDHHHGSGHEARPDPHLWLDPRNAMRIAEAVARSLAEIDPPNAGRYEANAVRLVGDLEALDAEAATRLAAAGDQPFVVFHDAYQYLERRYGLRAVGAVTVSPDQRPGAQRLRVLRRRIRDTGARCAFAEPQFESNLVATVVEGTGARVARLDPLGRAGGPPREAYFRMMRANVESLADCLGP